jgi:hypothetical protein
LLSTNDEAKSLVPIRQSAFRSAEAQFLFTTDLQEDNSIHALVFAVIGAFAQRFS